MFRPTFDEFCRMASEGNLIPVYREILADMETPVSAFRKINRGGYAFLLESLEGGEKWARYSFLGSNPSLVFKSRGQAAELIFSRGVKQLTIETDPLELLKATLADFRPAQVEGLPRFFGGMVGFFGYDTIRFLERLPTLARDDLELPDAFFLLTDTLLIFDNVTHKIKVVSNAFVPETGASELQDAYDEARGKIEALIAALRLPAPLPPPPSRQSVPLTLQSTFTKEEFIKAVEACKEYVRAGDVVQVVLSQRFQSRALADPFDIYRALRVVNPSPYMYYLQLGELQLIGSSPEILVRLEGERIDLRPIAGTRPRGRGEEDRAFEGELLSDPKERAEHIMLVDLGRNDVGRVAEVGSVSVSELMVVERYSHVMHLVSHIQGRLAEGKDAFDVFRACFPAGTVTGAPKIRAMEIIEELEPVRRGPYAGAVGYFSFSGNMDTCITIRTILIKGRMAFVQAGAGIVADSDPEREYQETLNKAQGMLKAIELAESGLDSS